MLARALATLPPPPPSPKYAPWSFMSGARGRDAADPEPTAAASPRRCRCSSADWRSSPTADVAVASASVDANNGAILRVVAAPCTFAAASSNSCDTRIANARVCD